MYWDRCTDLWNRIKCPEVSTFQWFTDFEKTVKTIQKVSNNVF